jgi:hypothetical protein
MARPEIEITAKQVEQLASIGAKNTEIADFFGCSVDTIERRFAGDLTKGRANLRMSLRRWQLKAAEKGNSALLIWLGKQMLDQKDKALLEHSGPDGSPIQTVNKNDMTDEQLDHKIYALLGKSTDVTPDGSE